MRRLFAITAVALLLGGCTSFVVDRMAPTLGEIARFGNTKTDVGFMEDALPASILQIEGMLQLSPDNELLMLMVAQAKCGYALGYVEHVDPARASGYYLEGKDLALRALREQNSDFADAIEEGEPVREAVALVENVDDVPAVFWAGNCWGNWLNHNLTNPRAYFAVPDITALMQRVLDLDPEHYHGGAHLFFGSYYAAIPPMAGGGLEKARKHFDKAFEISDGKFLMVHYLFAKSYCTMLKDQVDPKTGKTGEELFDEMLAKIEAADADAVASLGLANAIAKRKAERLAAERDKYF